MNSLVRPLAALSIGLVIAGCAGVTDSDESQSVEAYTATRYLSDREWTSASNGWGPVERDRSNGESAGGDGRTLALNGVTYAKGLGVHASSDVRFTLAGNC